MHGVKMYSTCLNENPSDDHNPIRSTNTSSFPSDPSILSADLSLLEAALRNVTSSNRSLTSSTAYVSNQLISAANAARSVQQQQSPSLPTTIDSGGRTAVAYSKDNPPLSNFTLSMPNFSYPNLLQEVVHRSNSLVQLLNEVAKQQSCKTCGKNKINEGTTALTNAQFLTPKSIDITGSRVSFFCYKKL